MQIYIYILCIYIYTLYMFINAYFLYFHKIHLIVLIHIFTLEWNYDLLCYFKKVYLAAILNVFFDWLLCAQFPFGAAGAAVATVAAQVSNWSSREQHRFLLVVFSWCGDPKYFFPGPGDYLRGKLIPVFLGGCVIVLKYSYHVSWVRSLLRQWSHFII